MPYYIPKYYAINQKIKFIIEVIFIMAMKQRMRLNLDNWFQPDCSR